MHSETKGHVLNLFSVVMVATGPLLAKFGLVTASPGQAALVNTFTIATASLLYGFAVKSPVTFYRDRKVFILALFNFLGVIFLFISLDLLSPVQIGFLGRFYTVFAVILSVLILKETISRREWGWIALAVAGAFVFMETGSGYTSQAAGSVFALLYTFFFALTNICIKLTLTEKREANSLLFTSNMVTGFLVLLYAGGSGDLHLAEWTFYSTGMIVLSSLLSGFSGTILLYAALKYLRFAIANATRAFSPVILAALSYPFFPVPLTWQNIIGATILLCSVVCLSFPARAKKNTETDR
ncbi:multidrug DMT transporter permease [Alteribacter lacisalsi]|uniref:Multidrug DMT transporter permease n=1 Tax=Alteribacter lacisalsi TaxID=2045244 RepID=A0A2W0H6S4_9BACI|nr:DMT family transporter [Alteribacter lacisalsi]PYZ97554.1 multidrug DMT transporter permease [Alteribacter lacisalsi]